MMSRPRRKLMAAFAIGLIAVGAVLSPMARAEDEAAPAPEPTAVAEPTREPIDLNPMDDLAAADRARLNPTAARLPAVPSPAAETAQDAPDTSEDQADSTPSGEPEASGEAAQTAIGADDPAPAGNADREVVETAQPAIDAATTNAAASDAAVGDGGSGLSAGAGGTIIQSATITGNNRGSEIVVNDCAYGSVQIDGGEIINSSDIDLSANGGAAVSTANGGDDNVVRAGGAVASQLITAGNGGAAGAGANGGTIITGATITGNNRGHEVAFAECPGGRGTATLIVDAGDITNTTEISMSANGGTAIVDASGGDGNAGITGRRGDAAAGNGGSATSEADGGTIIAGPMITGNNRGNTIVIGRAAADGTGTSQGVVSSLGGSVLMVIDGGDITNASDIDLSADGGTAISDASGGGDNLAAGDAGAAGNGGSAESAANGGTLVTGAMITGNNRGNAITVGNVSGCAPASAPATNPGSVKPVSTITDPDPDQRASAARRAGNSGGRAVRVGALPNTGTGTAPAPIASGHLLATMATMGMVAVAGLSGAATRANRCA